MEEKVGELWHRFITRAADRRHLDAAVRLRDVRAGLAVFFRALGGDGGLQIEVVDSTTMKLRKNWLQRIAGIGDQVELAWRDHNALKLPALIAWFEEPSLNRDLYYWLAAMAANEPRVPRELAGDWLARNQLTVLFTLQRYPGLIGRYTRLVQAHLRQRPDPQRLEGPEAGAEQAIRRALRDPGSVRFLPRGRHDPAPVPLWLSPERHTADAVSRDDPDDAARDESESRELEDIGRRKAEQTDEPEGDRGLITIRMENIFTWGEFINLDRGSEDEEDLDKAEAVARDLDSLAISREQKSSGLRLKFDLDLPGSESDDEIVSEGLMLPEWDWRKQRLLENHCRVVEMTARDAEPMALPPYLSRTAKKLRSQFQLLAPARVWVRHQDDGQDIDLDAYLDFHCERHAGSPVGADGLYRELNSGARDLSCMLVADLSLSTDTWVNDRQRVIDVIRDSLFLFAESLHATGDAFSMVGFSSRKRDPIRIHLLKRFEESYSASVRGRIQLIKPGYYTRLGAAIRYASLQLQRQGTGRRLLLILSDGKPNDLDQYEGRYGIEDTRQAIIEVKRLGLQPFCVTIDRKGSEYLPHLFGSNGYAVIKNPLEMPSLLPKLYARLTA